ncbi:hypothetical protein AVEN_188854-1 [Araneus ventricosus]|uniref:Uncharacterized protein n=1 Tax=Araneus ventricosus TaxID=182803 RepID=A0A4Y2QIS0_ARAVE|nr:hypothetical protein AVEN_167291-1 [Araneus ventricosus]GBN63159.1 hypothetical protein AVEN_188854-1 [Araneus ventricosus]
MAPIDYSPISPLGKMALTILPKGMRKYYQFSHRILRPSKCIHQNKSRTPPHKLSPSEGHSDELHNVHFSRRLLSNYYKRYSGCRVTLSYSSTTAYSSLYTNLTFFILLIIFIREW